MSKARSAERYLYRQVCSAVKDRDVLCCIDRAPGGEISGVDLAMQLYATPAAYWEAMEDAERAQMVVRFWREPSTGNKRVASWFRLTEAGRATARSAK